MSGVMPTGVAPAVAAIPVWVGTTGAEAGFAGAAGALTVMVAAGATLSSVALWAVAFIVVALSGGELATAPGASILVAGISGMAALGVPVCGSARHDVPYAEATVGPSAVGAAGSRAALSELVMVEISAESAPEISGWPVGAKAWRVRTSRMTSICASLNARMMLRSARIALIVSDIVGISVQSRYAHTERQTGSEVVSSKPVSGLGSRRSIVQTASDVCRIVPRDSISAKLAAAASRTRRVRSWREHR